MYLYLSSIYLLLCPDHIVPFGKPSPVCKSKKPLFLLRFANSASLCVQHIGVGVGFDSSIDGGEGFLRFRTPDWLTFV